MVIIIIIILEGFHSRRIIQEYTPASTFIAVFQWLATRTAHSYISMATKLQHELGFSQENKITALLMMMVNIWVNMMTTA